MLNHIPPLPLINQHWRRGFLIKPRLILLSPVIILVLYLATSSVSRSVGLDSQHSNCHGVILSLATFGARVFKLEPVLTSLMHQKRQADLIIVHITLNSRTQNVSAFDVYRYITHFFGPCVWNGTGLGGLWCESKRVGRLWVLPGPDYGPASKVLGTLRALPDLHDDSCIISVDDDVVYSPWLVSELLLRANSAGPVGFSCEEVPAILAMSRVFFPTTVWWDVINENSFWRFPFDDMVRCKGWMHGYLGILYRKKFFAHDVFSTNGLPSGCFFHDDVRLAGYLAGRGIARFVIPHRVIPRPGSQHMEKNPVDALSMIENTMLTKQLPCVHAFQWD
jgi:hypothetical protein